MLKWATKPNIFGLKTIHIAKNSKFYSSCNGIASYILFAKEIIYFSCTQIVFLIKQTPSAKLSLCTLRTSSIRYPLLKPQHLLNSHLILSLLFNLNFLHQNDAQNS